MTVNMGVMGRRGTDRHLGKQEQRVSTKGHKMIVRGETKLVLLESISFFKWDYLSVIQPWLMKAGKALDRWMPLSSSWRMGTGHRSLLMDMNLPGF